MKYKKFAATALIAIAATGIAAGTSYAQPAAPAGQEQQATPSVQGEDRGVGYVTQLDAAAKSVVTTVTGGAFTLDDSAKVVSLTNAAGETVMQYPLAVQSGDQKREVAAAIDEDGRRLTLTPTAGSVAQIKDVSAQEWFFAELQHASLGAAVGAVIGALIGFFFLGFGLIPGALIGAVIGLLVAGGPSLIDAGQAYFAGQ
ncbi:DUF456 domain-containing protein [Nocardia blacklockiae]|uniref:DUF456 domain-containing protein n=1 Tax=Nocardia blacklockiae TaxID=480036 RepID=UPI0018960D66|nr:DUF456 domain-containing protein [Nocardia blacklockiae]MBF6170548.1 DUF456 domain-containing protein [Nocardia blacklockiae]